MTKRNKVQHHNALGSKAPNGGTLYASLPMNLARDGTLTAAARSVALYVWSHDPKFGQSRNDVAVKLGMSVNTVGKALTDLQKHGWIVREIHSRTSETWHLQMSNIPFTEDEIRALSGARLDQKLIQLDDRGTRSKTDLVEGTRSEIDPPTRSEIDLVTRSKTDPRSSRSRSAPEVHDWSSASTDQIETASYGQSLAAEEEPSQALEPAEDHESPEGSDEWSDLNPPTAADPWSAIGVRSTPLVSDPPIAEPEALDPWGPPPTLGEWSEPKEDVIPWPRDKPLPVDPWSTYVCDQTGEKLSRV
ncbi:Uncharacterised protein [Mycolicibacterium fortuitum]|uniref:Helix-turn-helix domain-containing protein n=1 Tax=Mycolicibacterium fortuitum TaxID=1766 RepID=A0A378V309_MYCFO|nr:Uncharacterised protein [Mycolicibacterium fortuitum]